MLIQNSCRQYDADIQRIRDGLEALEGGASDDIFQTRASPFEEQLPFNVAINLDEPEGVSASVGMMKQRLHYLLPIEQHVRPVALVPLELMYEVVDHFRQILTSFPHDEHPMDDLRRENGKIHEFVDDFWYGKTCHFPDTLLRRLRPYAPSAWDLECWLAKCLLRQVICGKFGVHYNDIEKDPEKGYYKIRNREESMEKPLATMGMLMVSIYLSKLSVRLAAWLPYELMVVQAPRNARAHSAFISGTEYYEKLEFPDSDEFPDLIFHTCLDHVLEWIESRNWHDSLLRISEEEYRGMFWDAVDEGTEEWRHTA